MIKNKTHFSKLVYKEQLCEIENRINQEIKVILITITEVFTERNWSEFDCSVDDGTFNIKQSLRKLARIFLMYIVLSINRISPNNKLLFCNRS